MERTLILLKPDAVQRRLMGQIINRFERRGFQVVGCKMMPITPELAQKHYAEHVGKPFFDGLLKFITSGPVLAMALQGEGVVALARTMMGKTNCAEADPGTIRGDFGTAKSFNLIHGSDSPQSAQRELALFFNDDELMDYDVNVMYWLD